MGRSSLTMKTTLPYLAALFSGSLAVPTNTQHLLDVEHYTSWKQTHGLTFRSTQEDNFRFKQFLKSRTFVNEHNKRHADGEETYTVTLNKFAAMPQDEFAEKYLSAPQLVLEYQCPFTPNHNGAPTTSAVDYVASGFVTSVKDQGSCGSCWTFGAVAAMEGALCKAGAESCQSWSGLSEQQLVDCASYNKELNPYDNHGCSGGFQSNALRYVIQNGGINMEENYGYTSGSTGKEQACAYNPTMPKHTISSCGRMDGTGDDNLAATLEENGVLTVAIDASSLGFQLYKNGIFNGCNGKVRLNHAVTLVAFGSTNGSPSFTIKNSWGGSWGDNGYIHFARENNNAGTGTCGVSSEAQWAIL